MSTAGYLNRRDWQPRRLVLAVRIAHTVELEAEQEAQILSRPTASVEAIAIEIEDVGWSANNRVYAQPEDN